MIGLVFPQHLEALFEQVGPHGLETVAHQVPEPGPLLPAEVLRSLQEAPAAVLEHRLVALAGQLFRFGGPYLVYGLVESGHDVETVEDVDGL